MNSSGRLPHFFMCVGFHFHHECENNFTYGLPAFEIFSNFFLDKKVLQKIKATRTLRRLTGHAHTDAFTKRNSRYLPKGKVEDLQLYCFKNVCHGEHDEP